MHPLNTWTRNNNHLLPEWHPFPNIVRATREDPNVIHFVGFTNDDDLAVMAGACGYVIDEITHFEAHGRSYYDYKISFRLSFCNPIDLPHYNRKLARHNLLSKEWNEEIVIDSNVTRRGFNFDLPGYLLTYSRLPSWFHKYKFSVHTHLRLVKDCAWMNRIDHKFIQRAKQQYEMRRELELLREVTSV